MFQALDCLYILIWICTSKITENNILRDLRFYSISIEANQEIKKPRFISWSETEIDTYLYSEIMNSLLFSSSCIHTQISWFELKPMLIPRFQGNTIFQITRIWSSLRDEKSRTSRRWVRFGCSETAEDCREWCVRGRSHYKKKQNMSVCRPRVLVYTKLLRVIK